MEADLARFYGLDLEEAVFGETPLSSRRLWVLLRNLPAESALVQRAMPDNGNVTAMPSTSSRQRVVTSLRGTNMSQLLRPAA